MSPGLIALLLGVLLILLMLMALTESVVLQILGWGNLKRSLIAALWMNLAAAPVLIGCILLTPNFGLASLGIAWLLSVLIQSGVLMLLKRGSKRQAWVAGFFASLASYLILILPIYLFQ